MKERDVYQEWLDLNQSTKVEYEKRSITDIVHLYKKDRLLINPSFQRYYRWTTKQKSKLIESILLGYPIPPIFMFKNKTKGVQKFEVIDGLQRLATILEFIGVLEKEIINEKEIFNKMEKTDVFNLEGYTWEMFEKSELDFAIDASSLLIIYLDNPESKENDLELKFEVFRRLNTSSTPLSRQEVRNSILVEKDPNLYKRLEDNIQMLRKEDRFNFLSDKNKQERVEIELFVVFSLIKNTIKNEEKYKHYFDLSGYTEILDKYSFELTNDIFEDDIIDFLSFMREYNWLEFRKYNGSEYTGSFINLFFETIVSIYFTNKKWITKKNVNKKFNISYTKWKTSNGLSNINSKSRLMKAIDWARDI